MGVLTLNETDKTGSNAGFFDCLTLWQGKISVKGSY